MCLFSVFSCPQATANSAMCLVSAVCISLIDVECQIVIAWTRILLAFEWSHTSSIKNL